jgi:hypothetical protein
MLWEWEWEWEEGCEEDDKTDKIKLINGCETKIIMQKSHKNLGFTYYQVVRGTLAPGLLPL